MSDIWPPQVKKLADAEAAMLATGSGRTSREETLTAIETWVTVKGHSTREEQRTARRLNKARNRTGRSADRSAADALSEED